MNIKDPFLAAYIEAALWSTSDDPDNGKEYLDQTYSSLDLAPETLAKMTQDCKDFETRASALLSIAYEDPNYGGIEYAGHDFWLTRNRHGCGFWDRGLGQIGEDLADLARSFGETDLYAGDDGKLYS